MPVTEDDDQAPLCPAGKPNRWMPLVLGLIALALVVGVPHSHAPPPLTLEQPTSRRKPMADFAFPTVGGPLWRLSQHRGQVVLLNFWAAWCPPCQEETPALVKLSNELHSQGLEVAGVSMDHDGLNSIRPFIAAYHVSYPILRPPPFSPLTSLVQALPTTFLIDRRGRIANVTVGALDTASCRAEVQRLLREPF